MAKWRIVTADAVPKGPKQKIHCFTCKKGVPSLGSAGRYHKGHECEWVPIP